MAKRRATAASDETTELALSEEPVKTEQHPSTLEEATTNYLLRCCIQSVCRSLSAVTDVRIIKDG